MPRPAAFARPLGMRGAHHASLRLLTAFEGFRGPGCVDLTGRETGLLPLAASLSPPTPPRPSAGEQEERNGESRERSPSPVCAAPRGLAEAVPGPSGAVGFRVSSERAYTGPGVGSEWA